MQAIIGNRLVGSLKPDSKPYEVRDAKLKGFLVRVQPSGSMSYIVEYARGKRITLAPVGVITPAQARDRALEILADVVKGGDPQAAKKAAKVENLKAYLNHEYGPWVETHRKDGKATLARLKACFVEEFGDKKLSDLNAWIVEKWRAARLKSGIRPATVNRDLIALKAALSKALEWGFLESHPLTDLKPSKVDISAKVRFLTEEEETRLRSALDERENRIRQQRANGNEWRAARGYECLPALNCAEFADHLKPMVLLSINTGLRQGELFSLQWSDADLERQMLTVNGSTAKSGKTRHIPLNAEAHGVLVAWCGADSGGDGLIFPSKDGKPFDHVNRAWSGVLRAAQIEAFRWHDMRHHFASRLVMAGVDLNTVRELLGHSDIKMTLRYAHLAPEHKAAAVARLVRPTVQAEDTSGQPLVSIADRRKATP
jgi:integrase